jgi:hypothetical protein
VALNAFAGKNAFTRLSLIIKLYYHDEYSIALHGEVEMKRLVTALVFVVATSVGAFAQSFPLPSGWQTRGRISVSKRAE